MFTAIQRHLHLRDLERRIRQHGWTAISVGDYEATPAWVYTLGFDETLNQPEVVLFDVPQEVANGLLHRAFRDLKSGELVFQDGEPWIIDGERYGVWRKVDASQIDGPDIWLAAAVNRREKRTGQRRGLEAFQLVLADEEERWPWDEGYNEAIRPRQPALWMPADPGARADMPDQERHARRLVRERGWTIVPIDGPDLHWAYTIGLTETFGIPDLIAFGPHGHGAARILDDAMAAARGGRLTLADGVRWNDLGFEVCWRRVDESQYLGFNWCFVAKEIRQERSGAREPVEMYQAFLPDDEGRYPWDQGCAKIMRALQPELFRPLELVLPGLPRALAGVRPV